MEGLTYKQIRPHTSECSAVKQVEAGAWPTPWWWPGQYRSARNQDAPAVRRLDSLGRRTRYESSGRTWIALRCNCTRCDAEMLVRAEVLTEAVPTGV